tara:strand:+ start:1219 stop:1410 length:192 start_codon:yes stop_codon:yes gene_type:complete
MSAENKQLSEVDIINAFKVRLFKEFEENCSDYQKTFYHPIYGDRDSQFEYKLCDIKELIHFCR